MLDALIALALALCPWAADPQPPITLLDQPAYEALARRHDIPPGSRGLTTWRPGPGGEVLDPRVYLSPGADERTLCHELRHTQQGYWHD